MAMVTVNGVRLCYERHGTAEVPLVMVHGSWLARRNWDSMVPHLAESLRVITYDRRGHGESERPSGQGSIREDVADLAALIEQLELAPAWVAGQSFGGAITLRLAGERPDLLRGIIAHEPGLFALVADDPAVAPMLEGFAKMNAAVMERIASGDHAGAAEQFIEEGLGPGLWAQFPPEMRQMIIEHAPTYLDEARDPDQFAFDLEWIRGFSRPALLTQGEQSAPVFPPVIRKLAEVMPYAEVRTFAGAGHPIQTEQPKAYAEAITEFVRKHTAGRAEPGGRRASSRHHPRP
jgi:pimeloyl-ACP methyl ester carboxylesterase